MWTMLGVCTLCYSAWYISIGLWRVYKIIKRKNYSSPHNEGV
jgi:preprotein translocase subunit SecF